MAVTVVVSVVINKTTKLLKGMLVMVYSLKLPVAEAAMVLTLRTLQVFGRVIFSGSAVVFGGFVFRTAWSSDKSAGISRSCFVVGGFVFSFG